MPGNELSSQQIHDHFSVKYHLGHMIDFYLIQRICRDVLGRLLQIADSAGSGEKLHNCIQSVWRYPALSGL